MLRRLAIIILVPNSVTMLGCSESDSGAALTIEGSVTIPNATVELEFAGTTISTVASSNGNYAVAIAEPTSDFLLGADTGSEVTASTVPLLLRARDASRPSIELVSWLPDSRTLMSLAGSDAVLSQDEHPGTRITPLTTVIHATMKAAAGGHSPPDVEVGAAERAMRSQRDGDEIVRLAAALQLIIENPAYSLPEGAASTVAFAEDVSGARAMLEQFAAQPGGDPTAPLVEAMLADPLVVSPYRKGLPANGYYDITLSRNGVVGRIGDCWTFDDNGTGRLQKGYWALASQLQPFRWNITTAGQLAMTLATPIDTYPILTVEKVASFYPDDAQLQQEIRETLTSGLQVAGRVTAEQLTRLWAGEDADLVRNQQTVAYELSEALAQYGIAARDVVATEDAWVGLLVHGDAVSQRPQAEWPATAAWLMQVVVPSDLPDLWGTEFDAGTAVMAAARVDFSDSGKAVATGGVSRMPATLDYEILDDGSLQLSYPTGEVQTVTIVTQLGYEFGLFSELVHVDGQTDFSYDRGILIDGEFALSTEQLLGEAGQYWQSTAGHDMFLPTSTGEMPLDSVFGFHFGSGGLMDRVWVDYGDWDSPDPYLYRGETWTFRLDQGVLRMEQHADRYRSSRCDPELEPSCYLARERTWRPVAQYGELLYVLESDRWSQAYFRCYWDDDQQAWVGDAGSSCDPEATYGWLIPPRVNAFYVDDEPAL